MTAKRVTLRLSGDAPVAGTTFAATLTYRTDAPPLTFNGDIASYRIAGSLDVDGLMLSSDTLNLRLSDDIDPNGDGIDPEDQIRIQGSLDSGAGASRSLTVLLFSRDTDVLDGVAPPETLSPEVFDAINIVTIRNGAEIVSGEVDVIEVETLDIIAAEDAQVVALLYESGLDRDGEIDQPGLNYWIDAVEGSLPGQAAPITERKLAAEFVRSSEFARVNGDPETLGPEAFVRQLYRNLLEREGDPEGIAFWTDRLETPGVSQGDVLLGFATSDENRAELPFVETLTEIEPGVWDFV
ncbi:MAG: DUF4214 domain-containing protein [Paracoccaceae bacterium]